MKFVSFANLFGGIHREKQTPLSSQDNRLSLNSFSLFLGKPLNKVKIQYFLLRRLIDISSALLLCSNVDNPWSVFFSLSSFPKAPAGYRTNIYYYFRRISSQYAKAHKLYEGSKGVNLSIADLTLNWIRRDCLGPNLIRFPGQKWAPPKTTLVSLVTSGIHIVRFDSVQQKPCRFLIGFNPQNVLFVLLFWMSSANFCIFQNGSWCLNIEKLVI